MLPPCALQGEGGKPPTMLITWFPQTQKYGTSVLFRTLQTKEQNYANSIVRMWIVCFFLKWAGSQDQCISHPWWAGVWESELQESGRLKRGLPGTKRTAMQMPCMQPFCRGRSPNQAPPLKPNSYIFLKQVLACKPQLTSDSAALMLGKCLQKCPQCKCLWC